jgi:hypothetical protein
VKRLLAVLLATLACTGQLSAQTFSGATCCSILTPRIRAGMLYSGEASDSLQREWLQAVVLWRFSKPMPLISEGVIHT